MVSLVTFVRPSWDDIAFAECLSVFGTQYKAEDKILLRRNSNLHIIYACEECH
jgi:hypothetical protein